MKIGVETIGYSELGKLKTSKILLEDTKRKPKGITLVNLVENLRTYNKLSI